MSGAVEYLFNYCAHNGCFNRRFTLADAYDQWKNGNGSIVTDVGASELNFKDATWTQSSRDPKTWFISLSMQFESGPIYGTISGRIGENGLFTLNSDTYDFDVKELQGRSFGGDLAIVKRNFLNAISDTIHGSGTPFQIKFTGSVKAPQPVYDKTFGTGSMSPKVLASVLVVATLVGLAAWLVVGGYRPSRDGLTEEAIAMSDMRRHCQVVRLDCSDLRLQERIAPEKSNGVGHWEFVVGLGETGPRYMVAVTPGVESQVAPLSPR